MLNETTRLSTCHSKIIKGVPNISTLDCFPRKKEFIKQGNKDQTSRSRECQCTKNVECWFGIYHSNTLLYFF